MALCAVAVALFPAGEFVERKRPAPCLLAAGSNDLNRHTYIHAYKQHRPILLLAGGGGEMLVVSFLSSLKKPVPKISFVVKT